MWFLLNSGLFYLVYIVVHVHMQIFSICDFSHDSFTYTFFPLTKFIHFTRDSLIWQFYTLSFIFSSNCSHVGRDVLSGFLNYVLTVSGVYFIPVYNMIKSTFTYNHTRLTESLVKNAWSHGRCMWFLSHKGYHACFSRSLIFSMSKSSAQAADGMKQLAQVSEHEYLFTNNPLITSAGGRDQKKADSRRNNPLGGQRHILFEDRTWRKTLAYAIILLSYAIYG